MPGRRDAGGSVPPAPVVAFLFLVAGLAVQLPHRNLRPVLWDEFLWYPEILRMAREVLSRADLAPIVHPTHWQYPPLFFVVAGETVRLLGESFFALRALSIASSASLAVWACLLGWEGGGARTGLLAGFFALSLPIVHRFGAALLVDPFQASLAGAALFLLARAERRRTGLLPAALAMALAGAVKYTSLILPAVLLVLLASDRLRGASGTRRRSREIAAAVAVAFLPLLFLRGSDVSLLRSMAYWRSLPFDWGDLGRLVPAPFLFALASPVIFRKRFPRSLRAAWLFLLFWLLFFFWRRQQTNWLFPTVVPLTAIAAWTVTRAFRGRARIVAWIVAVGLVLWGAYRSKVEIDSYAGRERIYGEAGAYVNRRVPSDGIVVVDALPLASPHYVRPATCDVRNGRYREGRYALLVPWVYENFKIRGFSGSAWGEVHEAEIRARWSLEKEYLLRGEKILEIYANPAFPRRQ